MSKFQRMEHFLFSLNVVAPLFILMVAGYISRQIKFVSGTFLFEANRFVFKFSLPLMLFQNIQSTFHGNFSNKELLVASVSGTVIVIIVLSIIIPLLIKRKGQQGSMIQGIYRSNFLIYGIPLATGMYGKEAITSISMLMGVIIPLYNVSAVIILSIFSEKEGELSMKKRIIKEITRNPLIIGCVAGLLFGILNIQLPHMIERPIIELAGIATPLALFVMGGEFKFRSLQNNIWKVLFATTARLVIIPLLAILTFVSLGFRGLDLSVLICLFATPTAVSSFIMAENMGCDGELAGQIVVLTTICSCLTIFLFIFALRSMGFL